MKDRGPSLYGLSTEPPAARPLDVSLKRITIYFGETQQLRVDLSLEAPHIAVPNLSWKELCPPLRS
ncbi:MAG: hypothetical protein ACO2PN_27325 [Pyrobaculum sp.]